MCIWKNQEGWIGRRFYLGTNKEVFGPETSAIHQLSLLSIVTGDRPAVYNFVDSTAIKCISDDALGPGQRFAVAAIEICSRVLDRSNTYTVRWVPAHSGAKGNEQADRWAKEATGASPLETVQEGYVDETSLSHMTRVATESRSRAAADWI